MDLVVAGQAFHWFDVPRAREEISRVLKKGGGVALLWNMLRGMHKIGEGVTAEDDDVSHVDSPVTSAYDLLLVRRAPEYTKVSHHVTVDKNVLEKFFGPEGYQMSRYPNPYRLDYEQLKEKTTEQFLHAARRGRRI